jgi:8-oxo-dGTP pyrophosphatase MutT (NUDIX family)
MAVKIRRGITAVIFRMKGQEPEFLILHRIKRWKGWEMLKGGKRGKEKPLETLKREIMEETGAKKFKVIAKLPFVLSFKISKQHVREMGFTHVSFPAYLIEYSGPISLINNKSIEHSKYKWVKYKDALKLLTFDTSKKELKAAYSFMKSSGLV